MKNLANILTISRLVLLPVIVALFFSTASWAAWACLALYIIGAATDFVDGWVARKFNQITAFGTFMDPISDKIFVATILFMLVAVDRITGLWVLAVVVILARELLVSGIREYLGPKNVKLPVTRLAKWKTTFQMLAAGLLIMAPYSAAAETAGLIFLVVAAGLTVITGWQYLKTGMAHVGD
jgi:cardiolipin synthase (CMP-forming)